MLVLSRRPDEKILLPSVPAIIKVISAQSGLVRLGIEAPSHVPIVREELTRQKRTAEVREGEEADASGQLPELRHVVRNRINNLMLGLTLLRMQLPECTPEVRQTLEGIEEELQALRRQFKSSTKVEVSEEVLPAALPT